MQEDKVMLEQGAEMLKGAALHFHQQEADHGQQAALSTGRYSDFKDSIPSVKPVSKSGGVDSVTVTLREF